jgi:drug/metabolite transporter (DMT)-like permease
MDDSTRLSRSLALLLALTVALGAIGEVLLAAGMKRVGGVVPGSLVAWSRLLITVFTAGEIWLGICALLLFFAGSLVLLSRIDYSYVQPVSASGYAIVALLGHAVLGERVGFWRWAGIGCIWLGVALVRQTSPRTTV